MMAMFALSENVATKDDVATLGAEFRIEMAALRTVLRTDLAIMRQEMELG